MRGLALQAFFDERELLSNEGVEVCSELWVDVAHLVWPLGGSGGQSDDTAGDEHGAGCGDNGVDEVLHGFSRCVKRWKAMLRPSSRRRQKSRLRVLS